MVASCNHENQCFRMHIVVPYEFDITGKSLILCHILQVDPVKFDKKNGKLSKKIQMPIRQLTLVEEFKKLEKKVKKEESEDKKSEVQEEMTRKMKCLFNYFISNFVFYIIKLVEGNDFFMKQREITFPEFSEENQVFDLKWSAQLY